MYPVTICPLFGSVNGDVEQLKGKLFISSKTSLVSNVFINSLWLHILDHIILVNIYSAEICSIMLNCVNIKGKTIYLLKNHIYSKKEAFRE